MFEPPLSADLQGITELTLMIPVRSGNVPAVGTMTYATRLRLLLRLLGGLRKNSQDVQRFKVFSDTVERIRFIHSFRLNLIGNTRLLLVVAFDGAWEPYMRAIWKDLGPLLDVIMCNCEDYPISVTCSFAEYDRWIRERQVPADFFYIHSATTTSDVFYLRKVEQIQRETRRVYIRDRDIALQTVPDPEAEALRVIKSADHLQELIRQGLGALAAVYQLKPWYNAEPGKTHADSDDAVLLRAVKMLLLELHKGVELPDGHRWTSRCIPEPLRQLYASPLAWFEQPLLEPESAQPVAKVAKSAPAQPQPKAIQWGIVASDEAIKSGAMLLFRIQDIEQARTFFSSLPVSSAAGKLQQKHFYLTISFTLQGLKKLALDPRVLAQLPEEFRVGMEQRARLLGDVYENHPDNWLLPRRNWPVDTAGGRELQLSAVDCVIQLRSVRDAGKYPERLDQQHPLWSEINRLADVTAIELLHVQPMMKRELGLFGFKDGISQPKLEADANQYWSDKVAPGELVLGYETDRDAGRRQMVDVPAALRDGSFLVVRKLQQNVAALEEFLAAQKGIRPKDLKALLMGRRPGHRGVALVKGSPHSNDFNFAADPNGERCPLQSHIRRANPRTHDEHQMIPRIARRGMSYGPLTPDKQGKGVDQGLMFMAYNSSIANQFEVIQRWMTGGNSAGGYSGATDPFVGVPQPDEVRTFRCIVDNEVRRFDLDRKITRKGETVVEPRLLTRLQWGLYLFVPSIAALRDGMTLLAPQDQPQVRVSRDESLAAAEDRLWLLLKNTAALDLKPEDIGARIVTFVQELQNAEVEKQLWKMLLEDMGIKRGGLTHAIWAYINQHHKVLATAYGVLVADYATMRQVLKNDETFVVDGAAHGLADGYSNRMQHSIGRIYLGLDDGPDYRYQSTAVNAAIAGVSEQQAYGVTRQVVDTALATLKAIVKPNRQLSIMALVDQVLASLCRYWFSVPDGVVIKAGGEPGSPLPFQAHCPYHFTAPSRYFFLPNPDPYTAQVGTWVGAGLTQSVLQLVQQWKNEGKTPDGLITQAIFNAMAQPEERASTIVGVLMGFLPTTMVNLWSIFTRWIDTRGLWRVQDQYLALLGEDATAAYRYLLAELMTAMQHDPTPEMIWRTAVTDTRVGQVPVQRGSKVVISVTAICQELKANNIQDVFPAFGGDRSGKAAPVHACPGYVMAIGVMMGVAAAVMEAGTLRPTQIPLTLELRD